MKLSVRSRLTSCRPFFGRIYRLYFYITKCFCCLSVSDVSVCCWPCVSVPGHVCHRAGEVISAGAWGESLILAGPLFGTNGDCGAPSLGRATLHGIRLVVGTGSGYTHCFAGGEFLSHSELRSLVLCLLIIWIVDTSPRNEFGPLHVSANRASTV